MRYGIFGLLLLFLLSACSSGVEQPAATTAPALPMETVTPDPVQGGNLNPILLVTREALPTIGVNRGLPIPLDPATLVASTTEDPTVGTLFTEIRFQRRRLGTDESYSLILKSDGTYLQNGQTGSTDLATVEALNAQIDSLNFFGLQGLMLGPAATNQNYRYRITITRGGQRRTIESEDGFMPQPYMLFIDALLRVGFYQAPEGPRPTDTPSTTQSS